MKTITKIVYGTLALIALNCFALLSTAQALVPPPDGGYPGGNTAEGQNALLRLTTGTFNTAVGFSSGQAFTTGNFNTAIGAGALLLTTADENTATGAGALLNGSGGFGNTANGAFALFSDPMVTSTRPPVMVRSLTTQPLATTQPSVLTRLPAIAPAATTRRLVVTPS
jgi:hypothetical protein